MSRLHSTKRWQQTRRLILHRDGGQCQMGGRKCTGVATTVHHILPASTHPHLFFDPQNLQAACKPCNYGDGAVVRVDNRTARQLLAHTQSLVEQQQATIEEQQEEIAELRRELKQRPEPRRERVTPRIY